MSCSTTSKQAARAAIQSGLPQNSNRFGYVTGTMLSRAAMTAQMTAAIDRGGRLAAPGVGLATAALKSRPKGLRRAGRGIVGGVRLASRVVPPLRQARKLVNQVEAVSGLVGDLAGAVSRQEPAGQVTQEKRRLLFFKSKVPVTLWRSSLTPALNRRDLIGPGRTIAASEGVMFRTEDKTWHRGTMVVDMPGGRRTISHLQRLSLPGAHYYFDRPISDEQAVGLAAGKVEPEGVPGYVGQVTPAEGLCPAWAQSKQALLRTRLHWPPQSSDRKANK